ncbi:MAG: putative DNA binding domain-containing protein [Lachnospiraceae bacterium]|nr:putative DNA binding domain-containing protein [Lachnospiraceae bacterium]
MALPISISDLINRRVVENARVEYKADWNPDPIVHSICAFANDIDNWGGGYIIIGIEEENGMPKLPVSGLEKSSVDRINKELLQKCNLIEPRYVPIVESVEYEGKNILVLWAPGGESRPYKCPLSVTGEKTEKVYYIRKLSNTIRANQQEEKELFQLSQTVPFDDRVNMKADIEDLRSGLISEYLHTVGSDLYRDCLKRPLSDVAADMRITGGPSEMKKPLNVGLMFFSEHPELYFEYARIEVVDKPDPTGVGMTEKIFTGPIDRQLRDALSYIRNYIIKEKIIKVSGQAESERISNFPYDAIEETLSNAVYHKSYQIGEPVTVTVTPDKMEITSIPGPDRTISDEDIANRKMVSRRYRNRRIGDFLKELHLVEGRNTGIPTILRAMQQNGSDLPVFETDAERSYLTVILPVHQQFLPQEDSNDEKKKRIRLTVPEIKQLIINNLSAYGELSTTELVKKIGYSKLTAVFGKAMKELVDEGDIEYTHPENLKHRNQKLRMRDPLEGNDR